MPHLVLSVRLPEGLSCSPNLSINLGRTATKITPSMALGYPFPYDLHCCCNGRKFGERQVNTDRYGQAIFQKSAKAVTARRVRLGSAREHNRVAVTSQFADQIERPAIFY